MLREDISYNFAPAFDRSQERRARDSWIRRWFRLEASTKAAWSGVPASIAIVASITVTGFWIEPEVNGSNLAILYMLAVIFSALRWSRRAAILSAVFGALSLDFFFVPPFRSFAVSDIWYLITLVGLLTVGLVVSILTVEAREEAAFARRREACTAALYSFTDSLASVSRLEDILETAACHFREIFQLPVVIVAPGEEALPVRFSIPQWPADEEENRIVSQMLENGQPFDGSQIRYRPLHTGQDTIGVIGFQKAASREPLPPDQNELLGIFMNQTALAITRAGLATKAKRAEVLQETDKLQKALLNSVSHNLRTPLSSILGAITTILEDGALLEPATQIGLLKTAQDEARRLDGLVKNLLDMTRLEGGAIHVRVEPCDVHDIVAAALHQLGEAAHDRQIRVKIAGDLPLVPMDAVPMVQVVVNLLDNAIKYSPVGSLIEIEAQREGTQLNIRVLDGGPGIPAADLERVFDKFFRVSLPGAPNGAGLGLSISKGLVEAHSGRIVAKSREGGGTEISVLLPLEAEDA